VKYIYLGLFIVWCVECEITYVKNPSLQCWSKFSWKSGVWNRWKWRRKSASCFSYVISAHLTYFTYLKGRNYCGIKDCEFRSILPQFLARDTNSQSFLPQFLIKKWTQIPNLFFLNFTKNWNYFESLHNICLGFQRRAHFFINSQF